MDRFAQRIIGFGVQAAAVDGVALCRRFNQATAGQGLPIRLSLDYDNLFRFERRRANLRILEIEAIGTVPYAPVSTAPVGSLIATFFEPPIAV